MNSIRRNVWACGRVDAGPQAGTIVYGIATAGGPVRVPIVSGRIVAMPLVVAVERILIL